MDGIVRAVHRRLALYLQLLGKDSEKLSTKSTTNYYTTSADSRATAQSLGDNVCCCWVNNADEFEACVGHCDLLDGHASEKREGTCTVHTL